MNEEQKLTRLVFPGMESPDDYFQEVSLHGLVLPCVLEVPERMTAHIRCGQKIIASYAPGNHLLDAQTISQIASTLDAEDLYCPLQLFYAADLTTISFDFYSINTPAIEVEIGVQCTVLDSLQFWSHYLSKRKNADLMTRGNFLSYLQADADKEVDSYSLKSIQEACGLTPGKSIVQEHDEEVEMLLTQMKLFSEYALRVDSHTIHRIRRKKYQDGIDWSRDADSAAKRFLKDECPTNAPLLSFSSTVSEHSRTLEKFTSPSTHILGCAELEDSQAYYLFEGMPSYGIHVLSRSDDAITFHVTPLHPFSDRQPSTKAVTIPLDTEKALGPVWAFDATVKISFGYWSSPDKMRAHFDQVKQQEEAERVARGEPPLE